MAASQRRAQLAFILATLGISGCYASHAEERYVTDCPGVPAPGPGIEARLGGETAGLASAPCGSFYASVVGGEAPGLYGYHPEDDRWRLLSGSTGDVLVDGTGVVHSLGDVDGYLTHAAHSGSSPSSARLGAADSWVSGSSPSVPWIVSAWTTETSGIISLAVLRAGQDPEPRELGAPGVAVAPRLCITGQGTLVLVYWGDVGAGPSLWAAVSTDAGQTFEFTNLEQRPGVDGAVSEDVVSGHDVACGMDWAFEVMTDGNNLRTAVLNADGEWSSGDVADFGVRPNLPRAMVSVGVALVTWSLRPPWEPTTQFALFERNGRRQRSLGPRSEPGVFAGGRRVGACASTQGFFVAALGAISHVGQNGHLSILERPEFAPHRGWRPGASACSDYGEVVVMVGGEVLAHLP